MTIADDLGTGYFQLSTVGVGALAVGIEDIRQRIYNLLNTIPGSDPFRPLFGCLAYSYADTPINTAVPNIKKAIIDAVTLWMPEITIQAITSSLNEDSQLVFYITYSLVDDDLTDTITYLNGALETNVANAVIISALVPQKITNGVYYVDFTVNGDAAYPAPLPQGWQTASDMLNWINSNWASYGRWYLTGTSLVLYLNEGIANTATLNVTEISRLTVMALSPNLDIGQFYSLNFSADGQSPTPAFPENTINNIGDLLLWVSNNWSSYGNWFILNNGVIVRPPDYTADFTADFDLGGFNDNIYLILQTESLTAATLSFN